MLAFRKVVGDDGDGSAGGGVFGGRRRFGFPGVVLVAVLLIIISIGPETVVLLTVEVLSLKYVGDGGVATGENSG